MDHFPDHVGDHVLHVLDPTDQKKLENLPKQSPENNVTNLLPVPYILTQYFTISCKKCYLFS